MGNRGYLTPREHKAFWIGFGLALIASACGLILGLVLAGWL